MRKEAFGVIFLLAGMILSHVAASADVGVVPFDSGTRVVREVAEALTGQGRSILEAYPWGSNIFLGLISLLPESARISAIEWGMRVSLGSSPDRAGDVSIDDLARWCVAQYPEDVRYPVIVVGSPNGAVAHLASLLRAPFLTTSFGLAFRHSTIDPNDVDAYRRTSSAVAERIRAANPGDGYEIVCHVDPLHDRSMVRVADFVRIKLLDVPEPYRLFVEEHLAPGGTIVLINCTYSWPQVPLASDVFLQVGGLGAVDPDEYADRWPIEEAAELRRESEWGCPQAFADAVVDYATAAGIRVIEIERDHPAEYSRLVYDAYLACDNVRSDAVMIDCFNHLNPRTNLVTGIPGLWLPFNTRDALDLVDRALTNKNLSTLYASPLPSFARSPDTAALSDWVGAIAPLGSLKWIGILPVKYPADPLSPYRFVRDMARLRDVLALDVPLHLSIDALASLLARGAEL